MDKATLIAIAVLVYAAANVTHEALGHGGACVLVGGKPVELNAVYFECDERGLGGAAIRWISAGGTLVNLIVGALAALGLRLSGRGATPGRYALWLLMTVSLLQGTGYWLFSGLGNLGDWAKVVEGRSPIWLYRGLLSLLGGLGYVVSIRASLRALAPFLGEGEPRVQRARTLMLIPYLAGGLLYVTAGLFNPVSPALVLISGAAASFGGTSALMWSFNLLRSPRWAAVDPGRPLSIERSPLLIACATAVALFFIVVLGRTLRL
ncbi:MAG: hypothetical protein U0359_17445 [Byssovorax sp.]